MPWKHPWTVKRTTIIAAEHAVMDTHTKLVPTPHASLIQSPWQPEAYHHTGTGQVLGPIPVLEKGVEVRSDTVGVATVNSLDPTG